MTVSLWRIAVETTNRKANDLSGSGAKATGGRWNSAGTPMVYCSENISLATLETLSHLRTGSLPFNRYLVRIDVPDAAWAKREVLNPLPAGWDALPSGLTSRQAGNHWIARGRTALLVVPSVIVPDEHNVLINPRHCRLAKIKAATVRRWLYDARFF